MIPFDIDGYFQHSPLHKAAWRGKTTEVEQLVKGGADVNAIDTWGQSPLHLIAEPYPQAHVTEEVQVVIAKLLLDAGANVNATANQDATPLHLAALNGSVELAVLLLEHGANINAKTSNGWTPLASALEGKHIQVAELLRTRGGNS